MSDTRLVYTEDDRHPGQPVIDIGFDFPVVLIEWPTGVWYSGQVGGIACMHPEVEGFYLPLSEEFWKPLKGISCPASCYGRPIGEELCRKLQAVWPNQENERLQIYFDPVFCDNGTEAWFPVQIRAHPAALEYPTLTYAETHRRTAEYRQKWGNQGRPGDDPERQQDWIRAGWNWAASLERVLHNHRGWLLMPDNCD